jgi:hypothetical protein
MNDELKYQRNFSCTEAGEPTGSEGQKIRFIKFDSGLDNMTVFELTQAPQQASSNNTGPSSTARSILSSSSTSSYLSSIKIPKTMIKLWPSTPLSPIDQLTPKPGPHGQERPNPFELSVSTSPSTAAGGQTPTLTHSSYHHHLLNTSPSASSLIRSATSNLTPQSQVQGPLTPTSPGGNLALATTQLTLHAPDFNMRQPPPSKHHKSFSDNSSTPSSSSASSSSNSNSNGNGNGSPPNSGPSKGQIHVKLIQARGLNVRSVNARPYVVVQFEQNEFVSRDPTDEMDKEVKGIATNLSRNGSSNALSALAAIGSRALPDASKRAKISTGTPPSSSASSARSSMASPNTMFGRLSAHNPVWKHEVSL